MRARCSASIFYLGCGVGKSLHTGSPGQRLAHRKGPLNAENAVRTTGLLTAGRKHRLGVLPECPQRSLVGNAPFPPVGGSADSYFLWKGVGEGIVITSTPGKGDRVRATDNNGVASEESASVHISRPVQMTSGPRCPATPPRPKKKGARPVLANLWLLLGVIKELLEVPIPSPSSIRRKPLLHISSCRFVIFMIIGLLTLFAVVACGKLPPEQGSLRQAG